MLLDYIITNTESTSDIINNNNNHSSTTTTTIEITKIVVIVSTILILLFVSFLILYLYIAYYSSSSSKTNNKIKIMATSKPLVNRKFENVQKKYKFDNDPTKSTFGRGSFGVVRKCYHWRNPRRVYACKTIPKSSTPPDMLVREVVNLQKINTHKYIISLIDIYEDSKFIHLICEPCYGGELYDRIINSRSNSSTNTDTDTNTDNDGTTTKKTKKFTDKDNAFLIRNILLAIGYMHTVPHIVHRDLKASNFLFVSNDDNQNIKIIDFGLSKHVPNKSRCEICRCGGSNGNGNNGSNGGAGSGGGDGGGSTIAASASSRGTRIDRDDDDDDDVNVKKIRTFDSILEEEEVDADWSSNNSNNNNNNNEEEGEENNNEIDPETKAILEEKFHTNYDCDCNLGRLKSKVGTPYYVAPEIMKQESYTNKCDVWSVGCIAYFILCSQLPFQGQTEKETLQIITQYYDDYNKNENDDIDNNEGKDSNDNKNNSNDNKNNITTEALYDSNKNEIWSRIPLAKDFVQCLLEPNPHRRLSAVRALKHPYLLKYCGEPPSDLRGIDDDDDDSDDDDGFTHNNNNDNKPRWGAISRLGARIATDYTDDDLDDDSERNINASTSTNRSIPFIGKLFRKTKSSFQ